MLEVLSVLPSDCGIRDATERHLHAFEWRFQQQKWPGVEVFGAERVGASPFFQLWMGSWSFRRMATTCSTPSTVA